MKKRPTKKQLRKKQERNEIAKKRVLSRRADLREAAKKKRDIERIQRELRHRQKPITNRKEARLVSQLEHNAQLLKALREEMEREKAVRRGINADLEKKGYHTLQEKLDYLGSEAEKKHAPD